MNIINLLVGAKFLSLIKEGKYPSRLTKTGEGGSLKYSSKELDYVLKNRLDRNSCPNSISIGILCCLFVILYIGGSGMILDYCDLPTKPGVLVSLSLITVISIIVSTIPYSLGRGYSFGLTLILALYLFDILLTLIGIFFMVKISIELDNFQMQLILFPAQALLLYICHYLMNSEIFSRVVLFFRIKRSVQEANK